MITKNTEQHKIEQLSKTKWNNRLLSIIIMIIMVIVSLPKMAYAQLFSGSEQKVSGASNSSVKLPNTEYTESTVDLRVKVLGGEIKLNRTWINGRWYINPVWANLRFVLDPLDNSVKVIDRAGIMYQRTGDENLYTYEQVSIKKTDTGWRWFDQQGNWINFDIKGRILEYGDVNDIKVSFLLDNDGRRIGIKDHFDELVYSFTYDNQERLTRATDREGRIVSYEWSDNKLIKVIDVMGNPWLYGYDSNGQLNQKTEPDGGIIKIDYILSTPAPITAMTSGKEGGVISQNSVITTRSAHQEIKLAQVGKITDKSGAVTIYNSQYGHVNKQYTITINSPLGKKTVTQFDAKGRILSKTINDSFTETYQRDETNHLVKYTNQQGLTTTIQYNQANYPIKITYPNGATELYEYNKKNKPTKLVNAKGDIVTFEYDSFNRLTKKINAVGKPEQQIFNFSYDRYGQQVGITLGEGEQGISLQKTFDRYGNVATFTDAMGYQYQYSYNIQGQLNKVQNPLKQTWIYNYNLAGHLLESIDPLKHRTHFITDFMGRVVNVTDALGNQTQFNYSINKDGRVVKVINALNQVTIYQYDTSGHLVKTISPTGLETQQIYNLEGKLIRQVDNADNTFIYKYGEKDSSLAGLLATTVYPTFTETYNYDALGNNTEVNQWLDIDTVLNNHIIYDQLGLVNSTTNAANKTTQFKNNALGQEIKSINALSGEISYSRDLFGNITNVTDAKGNQYRFEYDKNNNLIKETKALGNEVEYSYNQANQLIEQKEANGNRIQYQYDEAGNTIKQSYFNPDQLIPAQVVAYSYNEADQLIDILQTGDTNTHFSYQYNVLGQVILETITYGLGSNNITKSLKYSYDQEGNLASIIYPDNSKVSYSYDKNLLKQTILANGEVINWSDFQWFMPAKVTYPNAIQTNHYDPLQRLLQIGLTSNNKTIFQRKYTYDKAGNIIHIQTENGENNYYYDLLDRLTLAIPSVELQNLGIEVESYSYDDIDNRIGNAQHSGDWIYNNLNQLIKWGRGSNQTTLTYTPNSQLATEVTANKNLSYHYNAADRLIRVTNDNTELASYQYDPFGRRISKTVNGETTYFIYIDEGLLAELDHNGNIKVAYGWEPNTEWGSSPLWVATLTTNQTLETASYNYLIVDHLGTPQLAIDALGQQTWKIHSDSFNNSVLNPNNQITLNLRLPGQYYDQETGLSYNYSRDYNPKIGRYIQSDPIGINGGVNTFGYVGANPLLFRDPYGENPGALAWCFGGPVGCAIGGSIFIGAMFAPMIYQNYSNLFYNNNSDFGAIPSILGDLPAYLSEQCENDSVNSNDVDESSKGGSGSPNDDCDPKTDPNCIDVDKFWHEGTFGSPKKSLKYHFGEHGKDVNAKNMQQYMNKARVFAGRVKGRKGRLVEGETPNVYRYNFNGKYIDIQQPTNKVVSYGINKPTYRY